MPSKLIEIDTLGKILFKKNKRSKTISIRVKPFTGAVVSLPFYASYKTAEDFVCSKKEWIKKSLQKIKDVEKERVIFDENTQLKTRDHILKIQSAETDKISSYVSKSAINIKYPNKILISSDEVQSEIRQGIIKALRKEAKEYLPLRVKLLAEKYGFNYNNIFIKNLSSRWGSCSRKNNINLNLHLMRLPDNLIDYVILHELVHTIEKNHGISFWNKLDSITGNAKMLSKEVKKFSTVWF